LSGPVVFISRSRIKEGKLEGFRRFFSEGAEGLKRRKPGTVAFLAYLSEDSAEVEIVHVFPDADAMDRHMEGVVERSRQAGEFIESKGMEILGMPNDGTLQMFKNIAASGVPVSFRKEHIGGYLRVIAPE
jgi:quinol monooxygenase YgiN